VTIHPALFYLLICASFSGGFLLAAIFASSRYRTLSEDDLREMKRRWITAGRLEERRARWKEMKHGH